MLTVADIHLSYTQPCNLNDLLEYLNCLGIHAYFMIIVLYYSFFIDYTELLILLQHDYSIFMLNCLNTIMRLCFSP